MRPLLPLLNNLKAWALLMVSGLVVSCGSYQPSSYYDNDGIYASSEAPVEERTVQRAERPKADQPETENNGNYKGYFSQKSVEAEMLMQENDVFTDIDSYSSTDDLTEEDFQDDVETLGYSNNEYAGWGETASDDLVINVYGHSWGWNSWNYGWWNPFWGWDPYWGWNAWGPRWGWGWGHAGWGWGWNRFGWGWNAGWGWNRWGYAGLYGNRFYNNRIAYNRGRRAGYATGRRSTIGRTGSTVSRSRRSTIGRNGVDSRRRISSTRGGRTINRDGNIIRRSTDRRIARNGVSADNRVRRSVDARRQYRTADGRVRTRSGYRNGNRNSTIQRRGTSPSRNQGIRRPSSNSRSRGYSRPSRSSNRSYSRPSRSSSNRSFSRPSGSRSSGMSRSSGRSGGRSSGGRGGRRN